MLESISRLVKSHFVGGKVHPKTSIYRGFTTAMFECQRVNPTFCGLVTTNQNLHDPIIAARQKVELPPDVGAPTHAEVHGPGVVGDFPRTSTENSRSCENPTALVGWFSVSKWKGFHGISQWMYKDSYFHQMMIYRRKTIEITWNNYPQYHGWFLYSNNLRFHWTTGDFDGKLVFLLKCIYEWRTILFVHRNCHEQNWVVPYRLWRFSLFNNVQQQMLLLVLELELVLILVLVLVIVIVEVLVVQEAEAEAEAVAGAAEAAGVVGVGAWVGVGVR